MAEMDIWCRIFAEKFRIQSLCVHGQGGRGQPNVERCEVLGSKILKLCEHPLWMAFHFGNCSCARGNKTIYDARLRSF